MGSNRRKPMQLETLGAAWQRAVFRGLKVKNGASGFNSRKIAQTGNVVIENGRLVGSNWKLRLLLSVLLLFSLFPFNGLSSVGAHALIAVGDYAAGITSGTTCLRGIWCTTLILSSKR